MFKRAPRIRPVRRYPMPGYPVLGENREILYRPPESRLSALARDLARPAIPLALASFLAQPLAAPAQEEPGTHFKEGPAPPQEPLLEQDPPHARKIRCFSDREIAALIKDLNISIPEQAELEGRTVAPRSHGVFITEEQGRQVLVRFFRKNGILLGSEPDLDGYNRDKEIGFEFLDPKGGENSKLEGRKDLDRILVVNGAGYSIPSARLIVLRLQQAAHQYLGRLRSEGRLWKAPEEAIGRLESANEEDAAKAAEELKKLGPDVLADLAPHAAGKRVQDVIGAIVAAGVPPLLADLDSDDPQKRDAATNRLIELSEPVKACVEQELKKAEEEKRPEAAERCKLILQAIGD